MSIDGFQSQDIYFAAFFCYLYSSSALFRIELDDNGRATFTLNVPSLDAMEFHEELKQGKLAISDLAAYSREHSLIHCRLRKMRIDSTRVWEQTYVTVAPARSDSRPPEFWEAGRKALEQRRQERELREKKQKRELRRWPCSS